MTDWPVKALGDLLEVSIGGIWGSEAGEEEVDVFVYRSTELLKEGQLKEELTVRRSITARQLDSRKLEEGDLLLEKSGGGPKTPVGRVGLVKVLSGLSVCSNFMQLMRPRKKDVLPVYLHYFLNHFHVAGHTEDLQNNSTNIRNLKTTEYMEVEIPVPPLEEQKRIVALLDAATARVTELTACYEQARTHANNLFASALREALESNPDWPVKALGEMLELSYGKPLDAKDRDDNGLVPVYGANGVKAYSKKCLVAGPSIIVGRKGSAGELNFCEGPFWPLDVTYYVEHDANENDLAFLYYLLSLMDLPSLAKGVKPGINRNDVYALQATKPSLAEQKKIVVQLDAMKAKTAEMVATYDAKLRAAKNLRQSILEAAFRGDL